MFVFAYPQLNKNRNPASLKKQFGGKKYIEIYKEIYIYVDVVSSHVSYYFIIKS